MTAASDTSPLVLAQPIASRIAMAPEFEPQLTRSADPFDVVDGHDLVGLGHQDGEVSRPKAGDVVGAPGQARDRIREGWFDALTGGRPEALDQALEAVEFEHDDGRGSAVPPLAGILVGQDVLERDSVQQTGEGIAIASPATALRAGGAPASPATASLASSAPPASGSSAMRSPRSPTTVSPSTGSVRSNDRCSGPASAPCRTSADAIDRGPDHASARSGSTPDVNRRDSEVAIRRMRSVRLQVADPTTISKLAVVVATTITSNVPGETSMPWVTPTLSLRPRAADRGVRRAWMIPAGRAPKADPGYRSGPIYGAAWHRAGQSGAVRYRAGRSGGVRPADARSLPRASSASSSAMSGCSRWRTRSTR